MPQARFGGKLQEHTRSIVVIDDGAANSVQIAYPQKSWLMTTNNDSRQFWKQL